MTNGIHTAMALLDHRGNPLATVTTETRGITGEETWYPHPVNGTSYVTQDSAITITAIWAAINAISNGVAMCSGQVFERMTDGGRELARAHPVYDLIHDDSNDNLSAFEFQRTLVSNCLRFGNGYALIFWADDGYTPVSLELIPSQIVQPQWNDEGRLFYRILNYGDILPENVIHLRGLNSDGINGISPITNFRRTLGLTLATEDYGASVFSNGCNFRGYLQSAGKLTVENQDELRKQLKDIHSGAKNGNKIGILPPGMTFTPTSMTSEDAQLLATRKFQLQEVCRIYGVPGYIIDPESSSGDIESQSIDWVQNGLMPYLAQLKGEYNKKLLIGDDRKRHYIEFDHKKLHKAKIADIANMHIAYINAGVLNDNEVRQELDRNRVEGGDLFRFPLNTTTASNVQAAEDQGALPAPAAVPNIQNDIPANPDTPKKAVTEKIRSAVRGVLVDAVGRVVRRELKSMRHNLKKPGFLTHVEQFYAEQTDLTAEAIGPALAAWRAVGGTAPEEREIAGQWAVDARRTLVDALQEQTEDHAASIEAVLDRWDEAKVNQLVNAIMQSEEE